MVLASMRPGRFAPDNVVGDVVVGDEEVASMRPGRFAPDNRAVFPFLLGEVDHASMRPGRFAPDNLEREGERWVAGTASMRPGRFAPDNIACEVLDGFYI